MYTPNNHFVCRLFTCIRYTIWCMLYNDIKQYHSLLFTSAICFPVFAVYFVRSRVCEMSFMIYLNITSTKVRQKYMYKDSMLWCWSDLDDGVMCVASPGTPEVRKKYVIITVLGAHYNGWRHRSMCYDVTRHCDKVIAAWRPRSTFRGFTRHYDVIAKIWRHQMAHDAITRAGAGTKYNLAPSKIFFEFCFRV